MTDYFSALGARQDGRRHVHCKGDGLSGKRISHDTLPKFAEIGDLDLTHFLAPPPKGISASALRLWSEVKALIQKRVDQKKARSAAISTDTEWPRKETLPVHSLRQHSP